jgi:hypothetical protein
MRKKTYIISIVSIGIFCGLMIPILGGLIFPSIIEKAGGPFIASTTDKIILEKQGYSYKPSQSGTQYNFFRVSADGKKVEITIELIAYSVFVYSVICILLLLVFGLINKKYGLISQKFWSKFYS